MPSAAWHRALFRTALGGVHVYAWIFVFQYFYVTFADTGEALASTALTYALTQVTAVLLTPYGAGRIRHGIRRGMWLGTAAAALGFAVLGLALVGSFGTVGWGITIFAVLMGVYRALYWTPYEVERNGTSSRGLDIAMAFVPTITGLLLAVGFPIHVQLFCGAALCIAALIALRDVPERYEGYVWKYRETFHELFATENRITITRMVLDGIEGTALLLVWPITIFLIFDWSYAILGIVLTITLLATYTLRAVMRRMNLGNIPTFALATLAGSAWVMRLVVASPVGVVLVDTYFLAGRPETRGHDASAYEQTAENRTFVDEVTALKEMGMGIGRTILCIIVALVAWGGTFGAAAFTAFIAAAVAAILSVLIARSTHRVA
ncbi:MAG TPA: hypothetical protein VJH91_00020 [Candidatus Paceibacterota bacterium]